MYPRISWTTLQMIEECPKKYELYRQKKREPIPDKYVITGNVVHGVAELMFEGSLDEKQLVRWANRDFRRRVAEAQTPLGWGKDDFEKNKSRCLTAVRNLIEIEQEMDFAESLNGWKSELHIMKHYQGWSLEGYVDLARLQFMQIESELKWGVSEVWDIKTGSSHKNGQLEFYSVLCEAWYGVRPEVFGWIEPLGRGVVPVAVTQEDHDAMKKRITQAVSVVQGEDLPTTGFPKQCGRCSSATWCPAMDRAREMRIG